MLSNKWPEAKQAYTQLTETFPDQSEPHYVLARLAARKGKTKQARQHLRTALVRGWSYMAVLTRDPWMSQVREHAKVQRWLQERHVDREFLAPLDRSRPRRD